MKTFTYNFYYLLLASNVPQQRHSTHIIYCVVAATTQLYIQFPLLLHYFASEYNKEEAELKIL